MKISVAQCAGDYWHTFVANQIDHLDRYNSICLTKTERSINDRIGRYKMPLYSSHSSDIPGHIRLLNRITNRLWDVPFTFQKEIRQHKVKLLHAHFGPIGIQFLPVAMRMRLPLLTSFHGYDVYSLPRQKSYLSQLRDLFAYGYRFLVLSRHMKEDVNKLGCPANKVIVHHVGIDLSQFAYRTPMRQDSRVRILTVCNFMEKKGLRYLVKAMAIVCNNFPNIYLCLVGRAHFEGALREKQVVERLIKELELTDSVVLLGARDYFEIQEEYKQADLFVLPSVTAENGDKEGVPTVLMEAQACGLPVVSTYHSGIPEVVIDGKSGYLVPERNVSALADSICRLIVERDKWETMGKIGRSHIEKNYNVVIQREKLQKIYEQVIRLNLETASTQ